MSGHRHLSVAWRRFSVRPAVTVAAALACVAAVSMSSSQFGEAGDDGRRLDPRVAAIAARGGLRGSPDLQQFELTCERLSILTAQPIVEILRTVRSRPELDHVFMQWILAAPRGAEVAAVWVMERASETETASFISKVAAHRGRDRLWVVEAAIENEWSGAPAFLGTVVAHAMSQQWDACESVRLLATIYTLSNEPSRRSTAGEVHHVLMPLASRAAADLANRECWPTVLTGMTYGVARVDIAVLLRSAGLRLTRGQTAEMLGVSHRRSVAVALELLDSSHADVQEVQSAVVASLDGEDFLLRNAALRAIERAGLWWSALRESLGRLVASEDPAVRIGAVRALGTDPENWGVGVLVELLGSDLSPVVRVETVRRLGEFWAHSREAMTAVDRALSDASHEVSREAVFGILFRDPTHVGAIGRLLHLLSKREAADDVEVVERVQIAGSSTRLAILTMATDRLKSADSDVLWRLGALRAVRLLSHRDRELRTVLLSELSSEDLDVRAWARWICGDE